MPDAPLPPPTTPQVQTLHTRLQSTLLAAGFHYALPNQHPDGWRTGAVGLEAPGQPGETNAIWVVAPCSTGTDWADSVERTHRSIHPSIHPRLVVIAVTDETPDPAELVALEARLGNPTLARTPDALVPGPLADQLGVAEALDMADQRLRELDVTPPDPEPNYRKFFLRAQSAAFGVQLHRATPHTATTWLLIAACVLVWFADAVIAPSLIELGANHGPQTTSGQWWRLVTAGFLHGGLLHLVLNMWALKILGPLAERLLGHTAFLATFILSVIGGCIASMGWNPSAVSVGASGGIFGVAGAILGFMAWRRREVPRLIFRGLRTLLVLIVANLVLGFALAHFDIVRIDNAGHLGGLVVGTLCGVLLSRPLDRPHHHARRRLALIPLLTLLTFAAAFATARLPELAAKRRLLTSPEFNAVAHTYQAYLAVRERLDALPKNAPAHQVRDLANTLDIIERRLPTPSDPDLAHFADQLHRALATERDYLDAHGDYARQITLNQGPRATSAQQLDATWNKLLQGP